MKITQNYLEKSLTLPSRSQNTSRMNIVRSLRGKAWGANTKMLLTTYKALIRSHIDYAPSTTITMSNSTRASKAKQYAASLTGLTN